MHRTQILQHLEAAERHVAQGEGFIKDQRARIVELTRDGHDPSSATDLLKTFLATQALHIAGRDRIRADLAAADEADRAN
jgi:hypothetical protein